MKYGLFYIAVILIWLKTYLVQRFCFELPIEGYYQELILLLTPISSTILLLMVIYCLSGFRMRTAVIATSVLSSVVLWANVIYFRFFNDFISLPVLLQSNQAGDLRNSILCDSYEIGRRCINGKKPGQ